MQKTSAGPGWDQGKPTSDQEETEQTKGRNDQINTIEVEIRDNLDIYLPTYLKNVLICTGYDSSAALSELTESDFASMESFVRNELQDILAIEKNVQYEDIYGIYVCNRSNFKILPGHRKLLMEIQKFYKGRKMMALANGPKGKDNVNNSNNSNGNGENSKGGGANNSSSKPDEANNDEEKTNEKNDSWCLGFLTEESKSNRRGKARRSRSSKRKQTDSNSEFNDDVELDEIEFHAKRKCVDSLPGSRHSVDQLKISEESLEDKSSDSALDRKESGDLDQSLVVNDEEGKSLFGILNSRFKVSQVI